MKFVHLVVLRDKVHNKNIFSQHFSKKMEENILFFPEPKDKSDVIWIDENLNEYHIHSWILDLQSNVFKGIYKDESLSKHVINFPPNIILAFANILYLKHGESEKTYLKIDNVVAILRMCNQYECSYLEKLCVSYITKMLPEAAWDRTKLCAYQETDPEFVQDVLKFCVDTKNESLGHITLSHIKDRSDIVDLLLNYHGLKTLSKRKNEVIDNIPEFKKHLAELYKIKKQKI